MPISNIYQGDNSRLENGHEVAISGDLRKRKEARLDATKDATNCGDRQEREGPMGADPEDNVEGEAQQPLNVRGAYPAGIQPTRNTRLKGKKATEVISKLNGDGGK